MEGLENQNYKPIVGVEVTSQEDQLKIDETKFQQYLEAAQNKEEWKYGIDNARKLDSFLGSIEGNVREYVNFVNKQLKQLMDVGQYDPRDTGEYNIQNDKYGNAKQREYQVLKAIADDFNRSLESFLLDQDKTQKILLDEIGTISGRVAEVLEPYTEEALESEDQQERDLALAKKVKDFFVANANTGEVVNNTVKNRNDILKDLGV